MSKPPCATAKATCPVLTASGSTFQASHLGLLICATHSCYKINSLVEGLQTHSRLLADPELDGRMLSKQLSAEQMSRQHKVPIHCWREMLGKRLCTSLTSGRDHSGQRRAHKVGYSHSHESVSCTAVSSTYFVCGKHNRAHLVVHKVPERGILATHQLARRVVRREPLLRQLIQPVASMC